MAILAGRTKRAIIVIQLFLVASALVLASELLELAGLVDYDAVELSLLSILAGFVGLGYLVVYMASVVLIAMWIHRAHANLRDAGYANLEFSPGWAVGWFFIPIMNLFKPFQAMKELWATSFGEENQFASEASSDVAIWWGTFIVGNILANVSFRLQNLSDYQGSGMVVAAAVGAVSSIVTIVCAYKLLQIIKQISAAQQSGLGYSEVFA